MAWQRYVLALFITGAIFGTAFYAATWLDRQRIAEIRTAQDNVALDIQSSETKYELLGSLDCKTIQENPILSTELNSLAGHLQYAEDSLGATHSEVLQLKKQYSLLEIKDYLLMEQVANKCHTKPVFILYFYSNIGACPECAREGEVLTYLRQKYPGLRVYSFDYNLDLSALKTLIALRRVKNEFPALIINDHAPVYGFQDYEAMVKLIPELKTLATTTTTTPQN